MKKNTVGIFTVPNSRLIYCKAKVIKRVWHWHNKIYKWMRTEFRIDLHLHGQLILNIDAKAIQSKPHNAKQIFICKGMNFDSYLTSNTKINLKRNIALQIWKTQQWSQDWKRSVFIPIPRKGNAKECSNYCTVALILHASKVMLKIHQARTTTNCGIFFKRWEYQTA